MPSHSFGVSDWFWFGLLCFAGSSLLKIAAFFFFLALRVVLMTKCQSLIFGTYGYVRDISEGRGHHFPGNWKCLCMFSGFAEWARHWKGTDKGIQSHIVGRGKWEMGASHCWLVHKRPVQVRLRVQIEQILHVLTEQNNNTFITHLPFTHYT